MIGIYKIISPTNKIYIGQSLNIKKRFNSYKNLHCKSQIKLYHSLKKYGYINHVFEIIEECEFDNLNERERYYQDLYDVLNQIKGLNCKLTETNDKSGKLSRETCIKIGIAHKDKIITNEQRENMSKGHKNRIVSDNQKLLMKINYHNQIKKLGNPNSKKVICIKTGKIWNTIKECAENINLNKSHLAKCLKGFYKNKTTIRYYINYE